MRGVSVGLRVVFAWVVLAYGYEVTSYRDGGPYWLGALLLAAVAIVVLIHTSKRCMGPVGARIRHDQRGRVV